MENRMKILVITMSKLTFQHVIDYDKATINLSNGNDKLCDLKELLGE